MNSSAILLMSYAADARRLWITFTTGRAYVYEDVPPDLFEDFLAAQSKGRFFNDAVRGRFTFREIPRGGYRRNRSAA